MMDEIKKVLLFGVGAVASTYERATEVVDDLVKKGKITIDEGKEFVKNTKLIQMMKLLQNNIKKLIKNMIELNKHI